MELFSVKSRFDIYQPIVKRICLLTLAFLIEQDVSVGINFTNFDLALQDVKDISSKPPGISRIFDISFCLADEPLANVDAKRGEG